MANMKKYILIASVFFSLHSEAQNVPINLRFSTTSTPDTIAFNNASIQIGEPFLMDTVKMVKLYIQQTLALSATDNVTRSRILIAPATVAGVISFNPVTMKMVVNKVALNQILSFYGINIQVINQVY